MLTGHRVLGVPVSLPLSLAPRHCAQPVNRGHQAHWSPTIPGNAEDYSEQTCTCSPEPSPIEKWVTVSSSAALSVAEGPPSSTLGV